MLSLKQRSDFAADVRALLVCYVPSISPGGSSHLSLFLADFVSRLPAGCSESPEDVPDAPCGRGPGTQFRAPAVEPADPGDGPGS